MAAVAPEWLFDTLQMIDRDYQPLMSKYSEQGNVILEEDFPAWDRFYRALVNFRRQFRDCYESRVQLLPLLKFLKAHGTEFKATAKRISTSLRSLPEAGELPDKIVEIIYLGQQLEDDIIFVHTPRLCRPIYCTRSVITAALTAYQFGPSFDVVFNALIEFEKVIGEMSRPSLYDDVTLREAHQNYQQFMANRLDLSSPTCVARAIAVSTILYLAARRRRFDHQIGPSQVIGITIQEVYVFCQKYPGPLLDQMIAAMVTSMHTIFVIMHQANRFHHRHLDGYCQDEIICNELLSKV